MGFGERQRQQEDDKKKETHTTINKRLYRGNFENEMMQISSGLPVLKSEVYSHLRN